MKILYISHSSYIGGAERSMMYMAMGQKDSLLLAPSYGDCPIFELYKENNVNYKILTIPGLFYHQYGKLTILKVCYFIFFLPNLFKLFNLIKKEKAKIIHFNDVVFAPYVPFLKMIYGSRLKIVTHIRSRLPRHRLGVSRYFFTKWLKKSDRLIAIGDAENEPFKDLDKSVIFRNPVSFDNYKPKYKKNSTLIKKYNLSDSDITAGVFSMLHPGKGHSFLINTLNEYFKKSEDKKLKIIIFGKGKLENRIRNLIKESEYNDRFILAGQINNVYETMEGCDFIIRPEEHGMLGRDILEANALGIPILTSVLDIKLYSDILKEDFNCKTFSPLNGKEFQISLKVMLNKYRELRGKTRKNEFGFLLKEKYNEKLNTIYENLNA